MPTIEDLRPLTIDLLLLLATSIVFVVDLVLPHGRKRSVGVLAASLIAGLLVASFWIDVGGSAFSNAYETTAWTMLFKRIALLAGAVGISGSVDHVHRYFPNRQGEFYVLLLCSLLGMTLISGVKDLLLLAVCFELMGIPLAMLATFAKSDHPNGIHRFASEAGLKLYLVSAASTAIMLFGLSLVYGMSGTTQLTDISHAAKSPLLGVGMMMTIAGMAFKVGAVPFHLWVPDTYQGAPTPVVAFLSVAPKASGLAALVLVTAIAFRDDAAQLQWLLLLLVVASIVVGNLMALPQRDVKRLLAFSGIAQIGYVLVGLAIGSQLGLSTALFYVVGYVVTNMGAFLVLEAVADHRSTVQLSDLNGLWKRSPWLALALLTFLLSLAGIPFVVGFWAKLYVFLAAYRSGYAWLVLFGALLATVALWYYLQVARAAYMTDAGDRPTIAVQPMLALAIAVCLFGVVGIGAWPSPLIEATDEAAAALWMQRDR